MMLYYSRHTLCFHIQEWYLQVSEGHARSRNAFPTSKILLQEGPLLGRHTLQNCCKCCLVLGHSGRRIDRYFWWWRMLDHLCVCFSRELRGVKAVNCGYAFSDGRLTALLVLLWLLLLWLLGWSPSSGRFPPSLVSKILLRTPRSRWVEWCSSASCRKVSWLATSKAKPLLVSLRLLRG